MLNGGADILTVQELLAHASPEMTMRYAKLLDDTKRKVFDNAIKQGIFSFDESTQLKEENNNEISNDILDMLWINHKLNAMDTPYGTCLQTANESGVTKATLYNNIQIKERIEFLRLQESKVSTRAQVKREMDDNNKDAIIESLRRKEKKLEEENKKLKEQLKVNYAGMYKQL